MFIHVRLPSVFQAWDDVVRKEKPKEDAFEYKKRLTLDHEKSKLSLAEIYEQEYIKLSQVRRSPRPQGGVPSWAVAVMAQTLGTRKPCSGVAAPRREAPGSPRLGVRQRAGASGAAVRHWSPELSQRIMNFPAVIIVVLQF